MLSVNKPCSTASEDEDHDSSSSFQDSSSSFQDSDYEFSDVNSSKDGFTDVLSNENAEEDEDEVIKAIRSECENKRNHPPLIQVEDFVTDICFHPKEDYLAIANTVGDVILYHYTTEKNVIARTLELHTKSCRDIEFSEDGKLLFSASKDKSVMLSNVETGKLVRFYDQAHENPIYCLSVVDEHRFATGDDSGCIKLWDLRRNLAEPIYRTKKNDDYISDMITNETCKYLLCSSGDGSLLTIDLQNRNVHMQSEEYEEELTCLGLFRSETKLLAGSSKGNLFLYNWNEFGLHSDAFPGNKRAISDLIPITENIVVTACEDGNLRATHLFPHRHLGIVGQHSMSVENVDICNNGHFIASSSLDNDIRFWNIEYFEDFEKLGHKHKKHNKKKEMTNNLPSSKVKNTSEFFSDL